MAVQYFGYLLILIYTFIELYRLSSTCIGPRIDHLPDAHLHPVPMRAELRPTEHAPIAHQTVVVRLLQAVVALDQRRRHSVPLPLLGRHHFAGIGRVRWAAAAAASGRRLGRVLLLILLVFAAAPFGRRGGHLLLGGQAALVVGHLAESGQPDVLQLAVLAPVGDHLVGVRADEGALEAVEVRGLVVLACVT